MLLALYPIDKIFRHCVRHCLCANDTNPLDIFWMEGVHQAVEIDVFKLLHAEKKRINFCGFFLKFLDVYPTGKDR